MGEVFQSKAARLAASLAAPPGSNRAEIDVAAI